MFYVLVNDTHPLFNDLTYPATKFISALTSDETGAINAYRPADDSSETAELELSRAGGSTSGASAQSASARLQCLPLCKMLHRMQASSAIPKIFKKLLLEIICFRCKCPLSVVCGSEVRLVDTEPSFYHCQYCSVSLCAMCSRSGAVPGNLLSSPRVLRLSVVDSLLQSLQFDTSRSLYSLLCKMFKTLPDDILGFADILGSTTCNPLSGVDGSEACISGGGSGGSGGGAEVVATIESPVSASASTVNKTVLCGLLHMLLKVSGLDQNESDTPSPLQVAILDRFRHGISCPAVTETDTNSVSAVVLVPGIVQYFINICANLFENIFSVELSEQDTIDFLKGVPISHKNGQNFAASVNFDALEIEVSISQEQHYSPIWLDSTVVCLCVSYGTQNSTQMRF